MKELITELQALAHAGMAYSESEFDTQRYERILQISALFVSLNYKHTYEEIFELFTKDVAALNFDNFKSMAPAALA